MTPPRLFTAADAQDAEHRYGCAYFVSTDQTNLPTAYAVTTAESDERWWYDVDVRAVKDENGLVVVHMEPSTSNTDGEKIAAAPHALSLVSRLSHLLNGIVSGDVGPAWKDRARELTREASALIADPSSSACITEENADTFVGR